MGHRTAEAPSLSILATLTEVGDESEEHQGGASYGRRRCESTRAAQAPPPNNPATPAPTNDEIIV